MLARLTPTQGRRSLRTFVLVAIAGCSGGGGISGSGNSTGASTGGDFGTVFVGTPGTTSGTPTSGSLISSGATSGAAGGASGTATSGVSASSMDAGEMDVSELADVGSDGSPPTVGPTDGGSDADVDGSAVDPWAGDPFADAAPPNEPADASYPDPANDGGAVTWADWVSGFSNVYCVACHNPEAPCAGSTCHIPSNPEIYALSFDLREKSEWTARAATIQCGIVATQDPSWSCNVAPEVFPKMVAGYPQPTDEARVAVAEWIEAGCP